MEHRDRLQKAIDNMGKTEHCLDIFDRALAEKDREIQQIREHEFQAGLNEGLAQVEHLAKALKNIIECEEQWTRHDMVREAKQALKEREEKCRRAHAEMSDQARKQILRTT